MKFGIRGPSLHGRIAARTSLLGYVRHSLGVKAPRGFGWFTNPGKPAYNRVDRRTTGDLFDLTRPGRRPSSAGGMIGVIVCAAIVILVLVELFGH